VTPIERLAELAVAFGANVQADQIVTVGASLGQEEMARAVAEAAYRLGARFVDVTYFDPYVKRARIANAREETLDFVPSWFGDRMHELGRQRCARISLAGAVAPGVLAGLDPKRAGRDQLPFIKELMTVISDRTTNWTVVATPTAEWASLVHSDLTQEDALARLWQEVVHVCRLDEPDPVAAWRRRMGALSAVAERLNGRALDALRFEGPGTELTIGLLPGGRFLTALESTLEGIEFMANLPSEEIFTTPDPLRADGTVRSTRPLVLADGTIIRGLQVRFEGGRAVEIDAEEGGGVMRGRAALDEGASRLGEVALVDAESRIGGLGTVFYETLLDENAVSHIALGDGLDDAVPDALRGRVNRSAIHIDFMIGGGDVAVTGVTPEGEEVPILRGGAWQIGS
jgi:aminopeptidase